jgi:hypothetical protein
MDFIERGSQTLQIGKLVLTKFAIAGGISGKPKCRSRRANPIALIFPTCLCW